MPLKERRNLSVQRICQRPDCGVLFHPWRGREATQPYCSNDCSRACRSLCPTRHLAHPGGTSPGYEHRWHPDSPHRQGDRSTAALRS